MSIKNEHIKIMHNMLDNALSMKDIYTKYPGYDKLEIKTALHGRKSIRAMKAELTTATDFLRNNKHSDKFISKRADEMVAVHLAWYALLKKQGKKLEAMQKRIDIIEANNCAINELLVENGLNLVGLRNITKL